MAWFGWAVASMALMGLGNLGMKAAGHWGLNPAAVLFWVVLGELPVAMAYWLWRGRPGGTIHATTWALVAGLLTAAALVAVNESFFRGAKTAVAIGVMNANFILVAVMAIFLFREQLLPSKWVGLAATLSGLWLMAR